MLALTFGKAASFDVMSLNDSKVYSSCSADAFSGLRSMKIPSLRFDFTTGTKPDHAGIGSVMDQRIL